jgi:mono/diheme cytochrome c family protein
MRWVPLAVIFAIGGCDRSTLASDVVDAPKVFAAYCAVCHGATGKPPAAMVAQIGVRDLTSVEVRARITPALVEHQVRKGSPNKLMPALEGALTDAQIKSVSAWVASPEFLGAPP